MFAAVTHRLLWVPLRFLFRLLAEFKVFGLEHTRGVQAPVLFVSNHHSRFDPFLVGIALPWSSRFHAVRWLTRDDEFKRPIRRCTLRLLGAFPGKIGMSYHETLQKPLTLLSAGASVGVFPEWCYEGDPTAIERMQYVLPLIAEATRRPVIPVFLFGIENVTWRRLLARRLAIHVEFGKPLYTENPLTADQLLVAINRALLDTRLRHLDAVHAEERKFWEEYGTFYHYLERADSYRELLADFAALLPERTSGKWIDLGSGSGAVAELLRERSISRTAVIATDHNEVMLTHLRRRFGNRITIESVDLAHALPYADGEFDGITANLVLPYLIHHRGELGKAALKKLLAEIHRIIKPGGVLVWSTPKENVHFIAAFIKSLPTMFRRDQRENLIAGPRILGQALKIQAKGRRGIYHFLGRRELTELLGEVGFTKITIDRSMAGQVYVIRGEKPEH